MAYLIENSTKMLRFTFLKFFCILLSVFLIYHGFFSVPYISGDGNEYYAVLESIVKNHSLSIRMYEGYGFSYGMHFFLYPALCVPAYLILQIIKVNTLAAFQLTNAIIASIAFLYVAMVSKQRISVKMFAIIGYLFSTVIFYRDWTSPEVFSSALVLIASFAFLDRKWLTASIMAAVSSLQNPSVVFMIAPIATAQFFELWDKRFTNIFTRKIVVSLGAVVVVSLISCVQYIWNYYAFGTIFHIKNIVGAIDYSLITFRRMFLFIFDLNQGVIVGMPLLLLAFPIVVLSRIIIAVRREKFFLQEDLLLVCFFLVSAPMLAQKNWNSGHNLFMRYQAIVGVLPLVWCAFMVDYVLQNNVLRTVIASASALLQISMVLCSDKESMLSCARFKPWVLPLWNIYPHFYNPEESTFLKRLNYCEGLLPNTVLKNDKGEILRILTHKNSIDAASKDVFGEHILLVPIDNRESSKPKIKNIGRGDYYVTGRMCCFAKLPAHINLSSSTVPIFKVDLNNAKGISIAIKGYFPKNTYTETKGAIQICVNGTQVGTIQITDSKIDFNEQVSLNSDLVRNDGIIQISFKHNNNVLPQYPSTKDPEYNKYFHGIRIESIDLGY